MSAWNYAPLAQLGKITTGSTPKSTDPDNYSGPIPFVTPSDLGSLAPIFSAARSLSTAGARTARVLPAGSVLVCCIGTVGKVGIAGTPVATNQQINSITFNNDLVDSRYGLHALHFMKTEVLSLSSVTTMPIISKSRFEKLKIPVPPISVQQNIANALDYTETLRVKRREAIALLEDLAQSIFLDMFGNPVSNSCGWPIRPFGEVCQTRLGKMLDARAQTGLHLRPYLRNANVQWFRIDTSDLLQMDFNEDDRRVFSLAPGDVLICEGGDPGRAAIWRGELQECYFQKALHRARPQEGVTLPDYVVHLLWFYSKRGGFNGHVSAATIAHLTGEKLRKISVPVPPIDTQHRFSRRIQSLDSLKLSHKASLAELDALFATIQHHAFRGELWNHAVA